MTSKEQFLKTHNKLSPVHLRATAEILNLFKTEKPALFSGDDWPIDKIRRPFVFWLTSLTQAKKEAMDKIR